MSSARSRKLTGGALALAGAAACAALATVAATPTTDPAANTAGAAEELVAWEEPIGGATPPEGTIALPASSGVWDPTLGRFREPTGAELAAIEAHALATRSWAERTAVPQIERLPDGSLRALVADRAFGASWGHVRADGTTDQRCLHSIDDASGHDLLAEASETRRE